MADYTFRIRLTLAPGEQLEIDTSSVDLSDLFHAQVEISSGSPEIPLRDSKRLILRGSGYGSEADALKAGQLFRDALTFTLARLQIGADFGDRAPRGFVTAHGLTLFEERIGRKALNDVHGLMVFETDYSPVMIDIGEARVIRGTSKERFLRALALAYESGSTLSERDRLSFDLFSASYFERSQDARLLTLTMAFEVLLSPLPRPAAVLDHVNNLIDLTLGSPKLLPSECDSLLGSLRWLRNESIGQAGRRLTQERLGDRQYMDMPADNFFTYCYGLRSRLIHGLEPTPTRSEVSTAAANFETMVADILAKPILEDAI